MIKNWIIFTAYGEGSAIAKKLQDEGKDVLLCIVEDLKDIGLDEVPEERKRRLKGYDGIVKKEFPDKVISNLLKVKDPENYFLLFDLNCLWPIADKLRDKGFNGNFPTKDDYELEKKQK